ncbi:hypothetical protein DFH07DRAFT_557709 [Mycena maculata]|uniref:DUF6534 domain-containing protein n=1 Tax=Mycena maculata TaxID=230809 RepID=A0AAD7IUD5_9AGAR|nr:hypothetical protein DFH07DRAFT_557709 [Mycena maculata]
MAPVVIPGVNLPFVTGPFVLGFMWSYCLYGMLIVQVYMYFETFPKDRRGLKALVWTMFVLETVFTVFMTIAAWNAYGPGWGDPDTLSVVNWSYEPLPALNSILAALAQGFYVWRIWTLSVRKMYIALPIVVIGGVMLTQVVAAFYYDIVVTLEGRAVYELYVHSAEVTTWLAASAVADVLITLSLVLILYRRKRTAAIPQTVGLMNRLIRFSVETGCVTSVGALIELALWVACPKWNWYYIFFLTLGKLYSNTLMATLNCRAPVFRADLSATVIMQSSLFWCDVLDEKSRPQSIELGSMRESRATDVRVVDKPKMSI